MRRIILSILFLALLLLLNYCKPTYVDAEEVETVANTVPSVVLQQLETSSEPLPIIASGVVGSKAETNLSFKIGGIIEKLYVDEGQKVRAGQLLAEVRTNEIDAQVLKARQAVDKAARDVERIEKLYKDSAATREQVQNLTTALEVARADLEIASFNQQYATIKAPHSGRVLSRMAEENELISPGAPVFRVASNKGKGYILKIGVADRDVVRIRLNDRADVELDAYPGETLSAYVSEIAEEADPRTGTFNIELTLAGGGKIIKNGFIAKLKLHPSQQDTYYRVKMSALVEGYRNQAFLFVPAENGTKARRILVKPGHIGAEYFTVSEQQLAGNSHIITDGAAYLEDGMDIQIVDQP